MSQLAAAPVRSALAWEAGIGPAMKAARAELDRTDRDWGQWMAAAQGGDRAAYERLLRACVPFIRAVAQRQGVSADALDDAIQETLLTIHRARHTYDPTRSLKAWLATIAQRRAIDVLRRHGRRRSFEVHAPLAYEGFADPQPDPAAAAQQSAQAAQLSQHIAELPARQREAVEQLAIADKSLAQAAHDTRRSPGALKVNLHRALKTLRARLIDENGQ